MKPILNRVPLTPNSFGIDGTVISASRTPTEYPSRLMATAERDVTKDFPTPPLPLTTAMTCLTLLSSWGFA